MTPAEANAAVAYAGELDTLVMPTDANVDTWAAALAHVPLESAKIIIRDYYGQHPSPDQRKPITAAHVRRLYQQRVTVHQAHQRATHQLPAPKRKRPPRRFIEQMQRLGMLTDRDPADYA